MIKNNRIYILFFVFVSMQLWAGEKYWVYFTDKKGVVFNPYTYFDSKTIENRKREGISLIDSTDFPLNGSYVIAVKSLTDSIGFCSRWLNAMVVYGNQEQLKNVKALPFVNRVESMVPIQVGIAQVPETPAEKSDIENLMNKQVNRLGVAHFTSNNIDGKGIRIAVFDAGFPGVDVHPAFKHVHERKGVVATYDFVRKKEFVYAYNSHGTMVLSCITGISNGQKIGLASGAEFLLARTENAIREPFSEEENWLAAAEWADKNGANIISSSLGYTYHRYFTEQMDGKTSFISKAALIASRKGILVVNAAGNEGDEKWKTLGTPADVDSVLTVGGIDPETDYHIDFSSYGPNKRFQMKPNVCAFGEAAVADKQGIKKMLGTSFSTPLIAGFAACAWQTNKVLKAQELFKELEKSSHLYPYFDYAHGFGVPNAAYFTSKEVKKTEPSFDVNKSDGIISVVIRDSFFVDSNSRKEGLTPAYFYYHIEDTKGVIWKYYVLNTEQKNILKIIASDYPKGYKLAMHYKGYTWIGEL